MKQDNPVTPVRNSLDRNHSVWTFQPNQVYRLINLIRGHEFHVMVSIAGTMAEDCGNFVSVDYDDFTVDLQSLSKYKAPIVTVKIMRHYKRVLVLRVDQKGFKKVTYEEITALAKNIIAGDFSKKAEIKTYLTDRGVGNIGQMAETLFPDFREFLLQMQSTLK